MRADRGQPLLGSRGNRAATVQTDVQQDVPSLAGWMASYGESIYGTSASSDAQPDWGRFTQRGDVLYAHLFEWPGRAFVLPVDASFIERVELPTAAKPVPVTWSPLAAEESGPRTDWRPVTLDAAEIGTSIAGDPVTLRFTIDGTVFKPFYETYGRYSVYLHVKMK